MSRFDSIQECAARWIAREDEGLDPAGQAAMEAWLAESDLHRVIYLRLQHAWRQADRLGALRAPGVETQHLLRRWATKSNFRAIAAVLLAVVICGGLYYQFGLQRGGYATAVG